jgi:hypothetical protein
MADRVRRVNYCYTKVSARPGQGAAVLDEIQKAGVNLLAFSGFPIGAGKAQLDLVAEDMAAVRRVARKNGWRLSKTKKAFLIQGDDRVGSCHRQLKKLAAQKINVTAVDAVAAGKGRWAAILWVKPQAYARAARALRAK